MTRILAQIVRARWALPDGRFLLLLFINKNRFYIIKDNERSETRAQREKCVMCILDHAGRQWKNENEKDSAKPQDRRRTSQFDQQQQQQRPNRETNNHKMKEREREREWERDITCSRTLGLWWTGQSIRTACSPYRPSVGLFIHFNYSIQILGVKMNSCVCSWMYMWLIRLQTATTNFHRGRYCWRSIVLLRPRIISNYATAKVSLSEAWSHLFKKIHVYLNIILSKFLQINFVPKSELNNCNEINDIE